MAPTPRSTAVNVARRVGGGWTLGVIGKRTYTVVDGRCMLTPEQIPLVEAPRKARDRAGLEHDTDLMLQRTRADVVVLGHARPHDRVSRFTANVRIGTLSRAIEVFGERRCERGHDGALRFTPADTVGAVPLTWEMAYGGFDAVAHRRYGDIVEQVSLKAGISYDPRFGIYGYCRNPFGRGYLLEDSPESLAACVLPALEDPAARLTPNTIVCAYARRWPSMPPVACTSWLPYDFFPRAARLGMPPLPYDLATVTADDFHEVRAGLLRPEAVAHGTTMAKRVDARVSQCSAAGMCADDVPAGAHVALTNMHPTLRTWSFTLPGEAPSMYVRLPDAEPIELDARVRTVLLEPDADRVCLVWVAELPMDTPLPDGHFEKLQHAVVWRDLTR